MSMDNNTDASRLDWLQSRVVDTIYLDDGKSVDVRGLDVRKAIDAAMVRWPTSLEDEEGDAKADAQYEAAARAAGWEHGGDNGGIIFHLETWGSWKAAVSWSGDEKMEPSGENDKPNVYSSWQECCEGEDIELK
jgi:hypothetical protein